MPPKGRKWKPMTEEEAHALLAKHAPNWRANLLDPVVLGRTLHATMGHQREPEIMGALELDRWSTIQRNAIWTRSHRHHGT